MFTVVPAGALPVIVTAVCVDGEDGLTVSELGGVTVLAVLTKSSCAEQAEVLPAASVAVALQVVVAPVVALTARPGEANAAALPVATAEPVQVALL